MSFAIRPEGIRRIYNYDDAVARFHSIRPWRGHDTDDWRPIGTPRKHHMSILLDSSGDVRCRLYRTDCVVYHPDNSISLEPWPSGSTNKFVGHIVPAGIEADYCHDDNMVWLHYYDPDTNRLTYRGYSVNGIIRVKRSIHGRGCWILHENSQTPYPLTQSALDRKQAREVSKEYQLTQFSQWLRAVAAMERHQPKKKLKPFQSMNYEYISDLNVADMMKQGFEGWKELARLWGYGCAAKVRMAVYRLEGAVIENKIDFIETTNRWGGYNQWKARNARYE